MKLLSQKQIDFYGRLQWKSKSKRLRKKADKIISKDGALRYTEGSNNVSNREVGKRLLDVLYEEI